MGRVVAVVRSMCPRKEDAQDEQLQTLEVQETKIHNEIVNPGHSVSVSYPILFSSQILRTAFMFLTPVTHLRVWKPKNQAEWKHIMSLMCLLILLVSRFTLKRVDRQSGQSKPEGKEGAGLGWAPTGSRVHT